MDILEVKQNLNKTVITPIFIISPNRHRLSLMRVSQEKTREDF